MEAREQIEQLRRDPAKFVQMFGGVPLSPWQKDLILSDKPVIINSGRGHFDYKRFKELVTHRAWQFWKRGRR